MEENKVIIKDPVMRKGFTQVSNILLRYPHISATALRIYSLLLSYAWSDGGCFPSQATLARDAGVSERTIKRAIKELKTLKLITVKQRGLNISNIYYVNTIPAKIIEEVESLKDKKNANSEVEGTNLSLLEGTPMSHYKDSWDNTQNKVFNKGGASPTKWGTPKNNASPVGMSINTGTLNKPVVAKRLVESDNPAVQYYAECYQEQMGKEHPALKLDQFIRVHETLENFGKNLNYDDWVRMIDRHFERNHPTDYNINHFATEGILQHVYWEGAY